MKFWGTIFDNLFGPITQSFPVQNLPFFGFSGKLVTSLIETGSHWLLILVGNIIITISFARLAKTFTVCNKKTVSKITFWPQILHEQMFEKKSRVDQFCGKKKEVWSWKCYILNFSLFFKQKKKCTTFWHQRKNTPRV